jgi:hypothetical protein
VTPTNINCCVDTVVPKDAPVYFLEESKGLLEFLLCRALGGGGYMRMYGLKRQDRGGGPEFRV